MSAGLNVIFIPVNSDNYCYYCYKDDFNEGFFIDVSDAGKVIEFANTMGFTPKHLMTTHKHWDHSAGNAEMSQNFPDLKIYGGVKDEIPCCTDPVSDGDVLCIGGMDIKCIHTPCHTKGHTCFYVTTHGAEEFKDNLERNKSEETGYVEVSGFHRALFSGDTLFIGTVGKFLEGSAKDMRNTLEKLHHLPKDTLVFPGHENTIDNLKFTRDMDKNNGKLEYILAESQKLLKEGYPTIPRTIKDIWKITLFCRYKDHDVQHLCGDKNEVDTLKILRDARDHGTHLGVM